MDRIHGAIFIYEGNKDFSGKSLGGLRIKNIISYKGDDTPSMIRSYEYSEGQENGLRYPTKTGYCYSQVQTVSAASGVEGAVYDYYISDPSVPLSNTGGSSVYYGKVIEYLGYPENCNGKTEYEFLYTDNDIDAWPSDPYYYLPNFAGIEAGFNFLPIFGSQLVDRGWTRGYPKRISVYSKKDKDFDLQKRTEYDYTFFERQKSIVGFDTFSNYWPVIPFKASIFGHLITSSKELFQYTDIIAETGLLKQTEVRDTLYFADKKLSTITKHYYDRLYNQYEITRTHQTCSDGRILKKNYSYPKDINSGIYSDMVTNNMLNPIVITTDSINDEFIRQKQTVYSGWLNSFIAPSRMIEKVGTDDNRTVFTFNNYDAKGNPIYITNENREDIVYLWGYEYQYPIAEIKNATYSEVVQAIYGGETTINFMANSNSPDVNSVNILRKSLPKALITTYTYKPTVGMLTKTDPNGITTYYEYDEAGRLILIKDSQGKTLKSFEYKYANQ